MPFAFVFGQGEYLAGRLPQCFDRRSWFSVGDVSCLLFLTEYEAGDVSCLLFLTEYEARDPAVYIDGLQCEDGVSDFVWRFSQQILLIGYFSLPVVVTVLVHMGDFR